MKEDHLESRSLTLAAKNHLRQYEFFRHSILPLARRVRSGVNSVRSHANRARLCYRTIEKKNFIHALRRAIQNEAGYAAGKIGPTAQYMLRYEIMLSGKHNSDEIRAFEKGLEFQCLKQQGLFPSDPGFYLRYSAFYVKHVRNLDCLGICFYPEELQLVKHHRMNNKLIHYVKQEPDRSVPNNDNNCYLQYFREKKILIICPFGQLLSERATKEIFEGVWSKTGKRWFYPQNVDGLEFPYGFSAETHKKYATVLDLLDDITCQVAKRDFDIALIGAAGLAIPIASFIKDMGKVAIDLGGHLQVVFGVMGERWRVREDWREPYFNDWWIDMPEKYRPKERDVCDSGAYW